jgi:hypothetical protein
MPKKKKYMVMARDKKTALAGITTKRGGHRDFGSKTTAMWISDKAEAEEIDHTYGLKGKGDVFVVEDEKYSHALNAEQWDMKFDERGSQLVTIHHYTQPGADRTKAGGNERVRVKTADGYTVVSRAVAIEEKLTIIPQKRTTRARRREVKRATA